jgi:multiple sugar transport system permease protein
VLLPFIVPTALSALAFWWLYDAQFSVISWMLMKMGLIHKYIDFLGDPWNARLSVIAPTSGAACPSWRSACSRAADDLAVALRGRGARRRHALAALLVRDAAALTPIIAVVMTFSVLFTFTDFQLIYVITRGGPLNATHLMATLSFQRAIPAGRSAKARRSRR